MALSPWFCAHTKMREERTAEDSARRAGFEVFLPLLVFQTPRGERRQFMFPGYLLLRPTTSCVIEAASALRGVDKVLGNPTPIRRGEVESLIETVGPTGELAQGVASAKSQNPVAIGERGEVIEGPLQTLAGCCVHSSEHRVILLLQMLDGRSTRVSLSPQHVRRAS